MSQRERDKWNGVWEAGASGHPRASGPPSSWLERMPPPPREGAWALDVGAGALRHARALAERGWRVLAVDVSLAAFRAAGPAPEGVTRLVADLDSWRPARSRFDLIVDVHYLNRPLAPALAAALRPGGSLLLIARIDPADAEREGGDPPRPFRLAPGEAAALFPDLQLVESEEDGDDGSATGRYHFRAPAVPGFEEGRKPRPRKEKRIESPESDGR